MLLKNSCCSKAELSLSLCPKKCAFTSFLTPYLQLKLLLFCRNCRSNDCTCLFWFNLNKRFWTKPPSKIFKICQISKLMMGLKTSAIITINKGFTQVFRVFAMKNIEFQRMNNFAWNCLDKN